jgi:hypothetical protein
MKRATTLVSLAALLCTAWSSVWAECSSTLVDAGVLTTVTVTAGPQEFCTWGDSNPNNSRALSVAGVAVPGILGTLASVSVSSVHSNGTGYTYSPASCGISTLPTCAKLVTTPTSALAPSYRECSVHNDIGGPSATATCIFQRIL